MAMPSSLGPYPVERELGRGGMGVVYLARDPKLDRPVAIKVLPDVLALNPDSLARFEREAKLLASLNHPNIAGIYGVEEAPSTGSGQGNRQQLLVLEYVPGETLAARISRGPLPVDEALDVCRQIAAALEAAHDGGIIHRDLKPANVRLTPDGKVKVLDFGLAKAMAPDSSSGQPELANSPTLTQSPTGIGVILGTVGYMSPEQARGKIVDKRTDVWAFGCVLYECLTGRQVFEGETVSDTIARILERDPNLTALPASTPASVRELLRRCLEKDSKKRQRDIGDVRLALEEALSARSSSSRASFAAAAPAAARSSVRSALQASLLVLAGAAVGIGAWTLARPRSTDAGGVMSLAVGVPSNIHAVGFKVTPDGRRFVILGARRKPDGSDEPRTQIFSRTIDADDFKPLPGSEGAQNIAIAPDSASVAFVAPISERSSQRHLMKAAFDGSSPPVALADWDDSWNVACTWLSDGDVLVAASAAMKLIRVPTTGGAPKSPVSIDTGGATGFARLTNELPNARGVFLSMETWGTRGYEEDLWLIDAANGKAHRLQENAGGAFVTPSGALIFSRFDTLMAAPFDLDRQIINGPIVPLANDLAFSQEGSHGFFALSTNGRLVFRPGGRIGEDRQLVVVDAVGRVTPFSDERRPFAAAPVLSRDGKKVAIIVPNAKGTFETFVAESGRPGLASLLAAPNADSDPGAWSPDGRSLAYTRMARDKDDGVYVHRADGSSSPAKGLVVESSDVSLNAQSWLPDGSGIVLTKVTNGRSGLMFAPVTPDGIGPARPMRAGGGNVLEAQVSPDGRLIAFVADDSGKPQLYVANFSPNGTMGSADMVPTPEPIAAPSWTADSRRLLFAMNSTLMSVTIDAKPGLTASMPVRLFDLKPLRINGNQWRALPDGKIVAVQMGAGEGDITSFTVVLNWFDELGDRMARAGQRR